MANSSQSRKRARQAEQHRSHNIAMRGTMRTYLKKAYSAVARKEASVAKAVFSQLVSVLDKLVSKGVIHKNKAARHKSRLNSHIKKLKSS